VHNISSFEREGGRFVVFSVVGATVLFMLSWMEADTTFSTVTLIREYGTRCLYWARPSAQTISHARYAPRFDT